MHLKLRVLLPIGLLLYAAGYCAFTLSLENTKMIGDSRGYDPGSQIVPLLAAACLAVTMIWELAHAVRDQSAGSPPTTSTVLLVIANIIISTGLVVLFRPMGFALSSSLAMFALIVLNMRVGETAVGWVGGVAGSIATLVYTAALYSLLRGAVHLCFHIARDYKLPMLRDPTVQALIAGIVVTGVMLAVHRGLTAINRSTPLALAVQVASGATLFTYVIFRMLFLVQLPAGLLNW